MQIRAEIAAQSNDDAAEDVLDDEMTFRFRAGGLAFESLLRSSCLGARLSMCLLARRLRKPCKERAGRHLGPY